MIERFYRILIFLTRKFGIWIFQVVSWGIATGFFLLFPKRVRMSVRFYQALFPGKDRFHHLLCAWKQYHRFTSGYLDRVLVQDLSAISFTSQGLEHLDRAIREKTGGIILMSHLGNWEVAAYLLHRIIAGCKLLLYMGVKQKEQIEGLQKETLAQRGIRIVAVDSAGGSPFDILEGAYFLREGGLVSMTGDVVWHPDQRTVSVSFLGHEALLPKTPFALARASGAPLFIFFSFSPRKRQYHFSATPPLYVGAAAGAVKGDAVQKAAQAYADLLARSLRRHPFEWYHFQPFIGRRLKAIQ